MEKFEFSVLMSVYKKDNYIYVDNAIKSLLNQSLLPNQIVIMVDGVISEELKVVLKKYESNNLFDIYYRDNNIGLGLTLNEGLKKCKYEYVARMDADDESMYDRFEKQISILKRNPEIDVVGCNMWEYDENMKNVISQKIVPENFNDIKEYIKTRNPINHPTVIYKKEKVLNSNSYEDYPFFEDYYLWAKMLKNGCIFYNMQEILYKFRAGPAMIKRRGGKKYLNCIKKIEKGLLDLKIIDRKTYVMNVIKRYIISLVPNFIRIIFYKNFLRRSVK